MQNNTDKLYEKFTNVNSNIIESLSTIVHGSNYSNIKSRMNVLINNIIIHDNNWLESKINAFLINSQNQTKENFSGLMGEIRAYGEILDVFSKDAVSSLKDGSDFEVNIGNEIIKIEINTPQQTSSPNKTTQYVDGNITSNAPFGYPTKKEYNIQYEATSKFANIKREKEGKQFTKNNVSILWLDLNDPTVFRFDLADQVSSIMSFKGAISSGSIWHAFYAKKNDWIYSDYTGMYHRNAIQMEFDGRFYNRKIDSQIDFVIVDAFTKKYILQNPNSKKKIPQDLFQHFFNLFNLNLSNSFIDFDSNRLKNNIENIRNLNNSFHSYLRE